MSRSAFRSWVGGGLVLAGSLLCVSCGPKREAVSPVHGQVLAGGKPAEGALVVFLPTDNSNPAALKPSGRVQADGSFNLSTYQAGDGAPPGDYVVTIIWYPDNAKEYALKHPGEDVPDKLNGRYADARVSKLRAHVNAEPNEIAPFKLP